MDNNLIEQHINEMRNRGVEESLYAPPLYQLAWAIGWHIAPPLIAGFFTNTLVLGILFGVPFGSLFAFQHADSHSPIETFLLVGPICGLLFGVGGAIAIRLKARSLGL